LYWNGESDVSATKLLTNASDGNLSGTDEKYLGELTDTQYLDTGLTVGTIIKSGVNFDVMVEALDKLKKLPNFEITKSASVIKLSLKSYEYNIESNGNANNVTSGTSSDAGALVTPIVTKVVVASESTADVVAARSEAANALATNIRDIVDMRAMIGNVEGFASGDNKQHTNIVAVLRTESNKSKYSEIFKNALTALINELRSELTKKKNYSAKKYVQDAMSNPDTFLMRGRPQGEISDDDKVNKYIIDAGELVGNIKSCYDAIITLLENTKINNGNYVTELSNVAKTDGSIGSVLFKMFNTDTKNSVSRLLIGKDFYNSGTNMKMFNDNSSATDVSGNIGSEYNTLKVLLACYGDDTTNDADFTIYRERTNFQQYTQYIKYFRDKIKIIIQEIIGTDDTIKRKIINFVQNQQTQPSEELATIINNGIARYMNANSTYGLANFIVLYNDIVKYSKPNFYNGLNMLPFMSSTWEKLHDTFDKMNKLKKMVASSSSESMEDNQMNRVREGKISATKMTLLHLVTGQSMKHPMVKNTLELCALLYDATDLKLAAVAPA
jgi:hypothetical protein